MVVVVVVGGGSLNNSLLAAKQPENLWTGLSVCRGEDKRNSHGVQIQFAIVADLFVVMKFRSGINTDGEISIYSN